jgi:hypothetical protein
LPTTTKEGKMKKLLLTLLLVVGFTSSVWAQPQITPRPAVNSNGEALTTFKAVNGTVSLPAITFASGTDNGLYWIGTDNWGLAANGVKKAEVAVGGITINTHLLFTDATYDIGAIGANRPKDIWISGKYHGDGSALTGVTTTGGVSNDGATTIASDVDASGDEIIDFATSGVSRWKIRGGTGHFVANSDNLYDIGQAASVRPRNIYAGTAVTSPSFVGDLTGNASGTAATFTGNLTGDVTSTGMATSIAAGVIVNADINASAAIVDTKLATISTAGKVANSATTAASANTASAIVARDGSGDFTAGTITANLTGTASTASTLTTFGQTSMVDGALPIVVGASYTTIDTFTTSAGTGISWDVGSDIATVPASGSYFIGVQFSFTGTNNVGFDCAVFRNNTTELNGIHFSRTMSGTATIGSASAMGIASLTAADTIRFKCKGTSAGHSVTPQDGQIVLFRIG